MAKMWPPYTKKDQKLAPLYRKGQNLTPDTKIYYPPIQNEFSPIKYDLPS